MSDNIHNTEKFIPKISLLMSFYHHFSFIMPVFVLHRACNFSIYIQSFRWNFLKFHGRQNPFVAEPPFSQTSPLLHFRRCSSLGSASRQSLLLARPHLHANRYIFVPAQLLPFFFPPSFCLNTYLSLVTSGNTAWFPGPCTRQQALPNPKESPEGKNKREKCNHHSCNSGAT